MWARLVLGLSLGVMMEWWPYSRSCGFPLAGYFAAVTTVTLAGLWAAAASWRLQSALAHTIAVALMFYGVVLAASELLPRTGYAAKHATWSCENLVPSPSLVISSYSHAELPASYR